VGRPYVQLMGRARVQCGDGWVDFLPERRYQLLAYLACAGDWVSRDQLAYLFWPQATTQTGRGNLRSLLERVRDVTGLSDFETERNRVRWQVTSDAARLRAALDRDSLPGGDPQEIVTLYTGRLLEGMDSYDGSGFENWLELEREHVYGRWREGMLRQVEVSENVDAGMALARLEVVLSHDPIDEEVVRLYLGIAMGRGQRERALRVYAKFARHLRHELGVQPADGTQRLARQIEMDDDPPSFAAGAGGTPEPTVAWAYELPLPATSFVGRVLELSEIGRALESPSCRLLTLVGPGGIGKTRLALQAAHELRGRYEAGCCVVSLESLSRHEAVPARIAEALGLDTGREDPLALVIGHLVSRRVLLVLDNFEHLMEGVDLVTTLLSRCPNLDLLVTSRERLNLTEEWLLPIEGLPFPDEAATAESASGFDAVELFVQRARRHAPRWALRGDDAASVVRICRLLEGNPLALELAAVWVRLMPLAEVVRELESNLDFLAASARHTTERHTSMRATFEHSWRLLSAVEQDGLRKLSVFRGGVTREAAAVVAGVSIPVLVALVDKSLVRVAPNGRYDRHPLLFRYGRQKLAEVPELEARVQERHAEYYIRLLIEWGSRFQGRHAERAMAVVQEDLDNILTAWRWAIDAVRVRELQQATAPLQQFFALQERGREGAEVFGQVIDVLSETDPHHRAALGYALVSHGYFLDAKDPNRLKVLQYGLKLLRPVRAGTGVMWGLYVLGLSAVWTGDREGARQYYHQTLLLALEEHDERAEGDSLTNLARLMQDGGEYEESIRFAREAVTVWQALGDDFGEVWALIWLGLAMLRSGRLDDAKSVQERAIRIAREREDTLQTSLLTAHRGLLAHAEGDLLLARDLHLEALAMSTGSLEDSFTKPMYLADLGRIEMTLGNDEAAYQRFTESLVLAVPHRWSAHQLSALAGVAELRARRGTRLPALELGFLVMHHAATEFVHRQHMRVLTEELRAAVPADEVAAALARSRRTLLEDVAQDEIRVHRPASEAGSEA
jgi:predicted ATPase/DNA-binding SARP family transcriptional activator